MVTKQNSITLKNILKEKHNQILNKDYNQLKLITKIKN